MTISLQFLFATINQIENESELQAVLAAKIGDYFAAQRSAIFFFDQLRRDRPKRLASRRQFSQKVLDVALSVEYNPLARYLVERHTPVHEGLVGVRPRYV